MDEIFTKAVLGVVRNNTDEPSDEATGDALLVEFHESRLARHRPSPSGSVGKTFATPGFLECDCVAEAKRGRYNEIVCCAHKLTLRNSRPHLESIEFSQKIASLAEQDSPLSKSMALLPPSRHPATESTSEDFDSVLLRASKSTSSLRQQHNFTSEPSISLLPSLYSKTTARPRSDGGTSESPSERKSFLLTSLALDTPTTLPLQEAQQMLELYNKIIRLNTETRKNMGIMYTRRSTLLAAMGKYSAALQDAEQVVLLDPKSTVVRTFACCVVFSVCISLFTCFGNVRDTTAKGVRFVAWDDLQRRAEPSNKG
ncbi:hypothetical protein PHYPSEUDO_010315 [Phytophthora pseudosyringae]|uniref:Uncharacterized protein n=1 Tax=Phytophthora pseudosyringae TaxID=221518 RepID=A0A8T1VB13_9STRA|nr:hypothetical protein PHYPSEUDO_010315 [Phytophthora pseudosyringae]